MYGISKKIDGKMFIFSSKPRYVTSQIDCLGKMSHVLRVSTYIYGVSKEIDGKTFILRVNLVGNCCHFATDHLHHYIHFTIYHLQLHFQCSEAQTISAISPKTCTLKLQLLHNMKRPTKWSGHVKMIDLPENFYIQKTFYLRG